MRNAELRFGGIEHISMMIVALVLAHIGRALSKKVNDSTLKHKRTAIFFMTAMFLVFIYIPWLRPLLRLP